MKFIKTKVKSMLFMTEVLIAKPKIKIDDKTFVKKSVKHYVVN